MVRTIGATRPFGRTQDVLFVLIGLIWHVAIVVENAVMADISTRMLVNQIKVIAPLSFLLLSAGRHFLDRGGFDNRRIGITAIGLMCPILFLASVLVRKSADPLVIGFHFAWPLVAYFAIPHLLHSWSLLRKIVFWNTIIGILVVLWHVFQGFAEDELGRFTLYTGRAKIAPGFINPNHYAAELVNLSVGAFILIMIRRRLAERLILVAVIAVATVGVYFSASRSSLVLLTFFAVVFVLMWTRRVKLMMVAIPIAVVLVVGFVSQQELDYDDIASGRIQLWTAYLQDWVSENDVGTILFGDEIEEIRVSERYNPLFVEMSVETKRFYTDNTYLNWLLELGLIGAVLFCLVPVLLFRKAWHAALSSPRPLLPILGMAGFVGVAIQGFFVTTVPTFANSTAFMTLVIFLPALFLSGDGVEAPLERGQLRRAISKSDRRPDFRGVISERPRSL